MTASRPFSILSPDRQTLPVVVEVPHAGLSVDARAMATLVAPVRSLGRDADLMVDELCAEAPKLGAPLLVSHVSRYVCDLNRGPGDYDPQAAPGGQLGNAPHGLIWRRTTEGAAAIAAPLTEAEFQRRMDEIYAPYHRALSQLLEATHQRFGYAVLLCAHSMPSAGRIGHVDTGSHRAHIVPGSRGRTTAAGAVVDCPDAAAKAFGWTVSHDQPYRGGFTTAHYARPAAGYHAIQIEMNRALYMDEDHLEPRRSDFVKAREFFSRVIRDLGALEPRLLLAPRAQTGQ